MFLNAIVAPAVARIVKLSRLFVTGVESLSFPRVPPSVTD